MSIRSAAASLVVVSSLLACAAGASAGTPAGAMTAYPAEDYPSAGAAIEGMAGPAANAMSAARTASAADGANVEIFAVAGPAAPEHLRRAGEAVVKQVPGSRYTLADAPASAEAPAVEVDVKELGRSTVSWQAAPVAHGTVSLTVVTGGARQSFSARYQEKPWADDFASFTNANPGRTWAVGRSARPWGSQAEASADALASAAEALAPVVRGRLKGSGRKAASDESRLRRIIVEELQAGTLVVDRFAQRFARPYGDVWSEAVLVDAAPEKLRSIADRYARDSRGREVRRARGFAAGGGLLVALSVLYLCLNSFTKGYFTWRLRAVTVLLAVVGMFVVMKVASP